MSYFVRYRSDYRELLKLGLPIMVGQLGIVIVGFMDGLMVGRYGGDDPLPRAAVSSMPRVRPETTSAPHFVRP